MTVGRLLLLSTLDSDFSACWDFLTARAEALRKSDIYFSRGVRAYKEIGRGHRVDGRYIFKIGCIDFFDSPEDYFENCRNNIIEHRDCLREFDRIAIAVRPDGEWWESYFYQKFNKQPGFNFSRFHCRTSIIDELYKLIDCIEHWLPETRLYALDRSWNFGNPKQLLANLTGWTELKSEKKVVVDDLDDINAGKFTAAFLQKEKRLLPYRDNEVLSELRARELPVEDSMKFDRFFQSMEGRSNVSVRVGPSLRAISSSVLAKTVPRSVKKGPPTEPKTVVLHIGKTGGTFLKTSIKAEDKKENSVVFSGHSTTLTNSLSRYGDSRLLGFFFRCPEERFVSSFNSRQRNGRPTYNVPWSADEKKAFNFFSNANELAESLSSGSATVRERANAAFLGIFHLRLDYAHYLQSAEAVEFEYNRGRIRLCCETDLIDQKLPHILHALGFEGSQFSVRARHESPPTQETFLSEIGRRNVRKKLERDQVIFEACRRVSDRLGFS